VFYRAAKIATGAHRLATGVPDGLYTQHVSRGNSQYWHSTLRRAATPAALSTCYVLRAAHSKSGNLIYTDNIITCSLAGNACGF
jgi:hypothetical protein